MNYSSMQNRMLAGLICLLAGAVSIQAQDSSAKSTPTTPSSLTTPDSDSALSKRLDVVEQKIQKLEKSPKDRWDKFSAISGLISGGVVVLVGLLVTYVVNERNRITAEQQKNRELAVLQVQTVQSFMPQLQSGGPKEVEAALLAIFALDTDSRLATDLAGLYRNEGSIAALRKIAAGPAPASAKLAQQSLASMVNVSLTQFTADFDDLRLSLSSLKTFNDLTNQVFWGLKGAVNAYSYETSWILRDKDTHKYFRKQTKDGDPSGFDGRSLDEVGIKPGMALEAVRMDAAEIDHPDQQIK